MAENERLNTADDVHTFLRERSNWGRWGQDDEIGAVNLITPEKRVRAAQLVRSGRAVSLSRDFPTVPSMGNPVPAQHTLQWHSYPDYGWAGDYYGIEYHGHSATHIDALCHNWGPEGLWGGKSQDDVFRPDGALWGDIAKWSAGIQTRGVLLDVPRYRNEPHVTLERPVRGSELAAIADSQGTPIEPGDALLVYSGRESWQSTHPDWSGYRPPNPGLDSSCLAFFRESDISLVGWDLADALPPVAGLEWSVHQVLYAFGVAILDNCLLQPLAEACAAEERYEFFLTVAPLKVVGGTGSPANPLALL